MLKYVAGRKVLEILNIEGFELLELVRDGKLNPINNYGKHVCDVKIRDEFVNHDNFKLLNEKMANDAILKVIETRFSHKYEAAKKEFEDKLKEKAAKGIVPQTFDELVPEKYKNCVWESFEMPYNEIEAEKTIKRFEEFLYLKAEVEGLKGEARENDGENDFAVGEGYLPISSDPSLKWSDITMRFLNDNELHIQFYEGPKALNITRRFDQLGFGDGRRNKDIWVNAWSLLLKAAKNKSIPHTFENRKIIESSVTALRKRLKAMFPTIQENPIPHSKKSKEYRLSFNCSAYINDLEVGQVLTRWFPS